MSLLDQLTDRVRDQFVRDGGPASAVAVASALRAEPTAAVLGDTSLLRIADRVHSDIAGTGPLAPLVADPAVTDVLVNGVDVWIDRGDGLRRVPGVFHHPDEVRRLATRLAASAGRRLDDASPYVDAQLPDGTRLHAILPPIAVAGPFLSLRTFRQRAFTLSELVPAPVAQLLAAIVAARLSFVVSGGTGSGKTSLLAAMLSLVPPTERIVVVEESAELHPRHPHAIGLQCRTSNVEGVGAVGLSDLVRQALRMRPDRLVVGECRGAEVVDLLAALNTGHEGGAGTVHANAAQDVPARLEALGLAGGLPRAALHAQLASALHVVLHLRRSPRVLDEVSVLLPSHGFVTAIPAWRRAGGPGSGAAHLASLLRVRAVPPPSLLGVA